MSGAQGSNNPTQLNYAAGVSSTANHFVDPGRPQPRMRLESLLDEVQIGLDQYTALCRSPLESLDIKCASDGVRMQPELSCDCSDLPVLGMEQAANGCDLFDRDHQLTPARKD